MKTLPCSECPHGSVCCKWGTFLSKQEGESLLKEFGEDVVSEMCLKLKDNGVSSFHFYCLNKAEPTLSIVKKIT